MSKADLRKLGATSEELAELRLHIVVTGWRWMDDGGICKDNLFEICPDYFAENVEYIFDNGIGHLFKKKIREVF